VPCEASCHLDGSRVGRAPRMAAFNDALTTRTEGRVALYCAGSNDGACGTHAFGRLRSATGSLAQ
jgi:hypothetical protein